jgi:hypothetical protein
MSVPRANSRYGAVSFLDMLGAKGIWKNRNPEDVLNNYNDVIKSFKAAIEALNEQIASNTALTIKNIEFEISAFSDTIIIAGSVPYERKNDEEMTSLVVYAMSLILPIIFPFALANKIYLRGAVSIGEFYKLDKMLIGPAVDEAAQYYMLPEWIGISAAPSLHYFLDNFNHNDLDAREFFVQWDIPLKNGIESHGWAINWPFKSKDLLVSDDEWKKKMESLFANIKDTMKNEMQSTEVSAALKWRNTSYFFKANVK